MKRLWILNHHSGLEGDRHYELAKEMAAAGMEVVVFLSAFDHQTETCICEKTVTIRKVQKGVSYVWLRTTPAYHGNGIARILNMIRYYQLIRLYGKMPGILRGKTRFPLSARSEISGRCHLRRSMAGPDFIRSAFFFLCWNAERTAGQMRL